MPNLAATLKEEIRRLAKREIKIETTKTKQAVARYRHDIARLKQEIASQQKEIERLKARQQGQQERSAANGEAEESQEKVRYSARSVRAQRQRLGLSAADYGMLIGVSGLTIYHWEHGKSRPRKAQLARLVAVRNIGKREALARLTSIQNETPSRTGKTTQRKPK